ncbi:MAG: type II toxin-antitoxin system prevent-host-death family antitoxin [Deltaproteobacteria bacterium]|nr:type II toxin-antitoxin system prevent-host-death family antitoxin [Deltaproteobacteria bacterium]
MKTITAANANRGFSNLLREVSKGEEITILSRGKPVARITSFNSEALRQKAMKNILLSRLKTQVITGVRNWTRDELYNDSSCV